MRVDGSRSAYQEAVTAPNDFDKAEIRRCRLILRRLRFLETKVRENGGLGNEDGNGGAGYTEWEIEALEWILSEIGFLAEIKL